MSQITADMAALQRRIFEENFFVDLYQQALDYNGALAKGIEDQIYTDKVTIFVANRFWFLLPDSQVIRKPIFFQLCRIAELSVDF